MLEDGAEAAAVEGAGDAEGDGRVGFDFGLSLGFGAFGIVSLVDCFSISVLENVALECGGGFVVGVMRGCLKMEFSSFQLLYYFVIFE